MIQSIKHLQKPVDEILLARSVLVLVEMLPAPSSSLVRPEFLVRFVADSESVDEIYLLLAHGRRRDTGGTILA